MLGILAGGGAWLMDAAIDPTQEQLLTPEESRARLADVRTWGYQLQRIDVDAAMRTPLDLIVTDATLNGGRNEPTYFNRSLQYLKQKSDGGRRIVLSYLSIGEAEDYRPYWKSPWVSAERRNDTPFAPTGVQPGQQAPTPVRFSHPALFWPLRNPTPSAPPWLGSENAEWRGNYAVRFWHPDWQKLLFGSPTAALDQIIDAGFDGAYLDRADVYGNWDSERPSSKADMTSLIATLSTYARKRRPGFLIVMQNAEELLGNKIVRKALDGAAKEDLLFGISGDGQPNSAEDIEASIAFLQMARKDGLPVFVIEYLDDPQTRTTATERIEKAGFIAYFGPRGLDRLGSTSHGPK